MGKLDTRVVAIGVSLKVLLCLNSQGREREGKGGREGGC